MNLFQASTVGALLTSEFCLRLTQSLLHFLWQGLAIWLLLWIANHALRRASSGARYAASVTALVLMLACLPATYLALGCLDRETRAAIVGRVSPSAADAPASTAIDNTASVVAVDANIAGVAPT